jgi:hypothetical protein
LLNSLEQYCDDFHLYVLAFDDIAYNHMSRRNHVTAIRMSDFETPELLAVKDKRSLVEYYWTCSPLIPLYCFKQYGLEDIIYIDADCCLFSDPQPFFDEVKDTNVAIAPHRFAPEVKARENRNGIYNVGVEYFKNNDVGNACLERWREECLDWCGSEYGGPRKFGDQAYLNDWPEKFGAHVIKHLGVDLAPWNQEQYQYDVRNYRVYVEKDPLIIYHFHQFKYLADKKAFIRCQWKLAPAVEKYVYPMFEAVYLEALRQIESA